jgi:hypothetical protein
MEWDSNLFVNQNKLIAAIVKISIDINKID